LQITNNRQGKAQKTLVARPHPGGGLAVMQGKAMATYWERETAGREP